MWRSQPLHLVRLVLLVVGCVCSFLAAYGMMSVRSELKRMRIQKPLPDLAGASTDPRHIAITTGKGGLWTSSKKSA